MPLRGYPFQGKQDEMVFATRTTGLFQVRYFLKRGNLTYTEKTLPETGSRSSPEEKILVKEVESIRFEYAYLDEEERLVFKPVWLEEPYFGIPRAVKIEVKLKEGGGNFSRLIAIPQGSWGRVTDKEEIHE